MKKFSFLILLTFFLLEAFSQEHKQVDSLLNVLSATSDKKEIKKTYNRLKDEIINAYNDLEKTLKAERLENQYYIVKQGAEIEELKRSKQLNDALIKNQNQIIISGVFVLVIVFVLLIILILYLKKKNTSYKLLNEQKDSILSQRKEIAIQRDNLSKLAFELKKQNKTKNKFFSVLAHDLKNPFQSILGFSELLTSEIKNENFEKIKTFSGYIYDTAYNTYVLLENFLDWAKVQAGVLKYNPINVSLSELIEESINIARNSAKAKNIKLEIDCDEKAEIFVDESMILTVIRNLVSNAIKFTERGGAVNVTTEVNCENVNILVKDNGIGIKESKISKIFKANLSYTTNGTDNEKGSGLGLSVCEDFIQKNKGKIIVKSKSGVGSTFTVTLPKAK